MTDANGTRAVDGQAARQPDALPRDGGRGRRRDSSSAPGEATITARLPLDGAAVGAALPQLRRPFELPVVLQNQTDAPMTVRRGGARDQRDAHRRRGPRASRCRPTTASRSGFPAAAEMAGTARFQIGACRSRTLGRRGRVRAAGVDAGDHRGVRDLRRDRQGRDQRSRSKLPGGRRSREFGGLEVTTSLDGSCRR